MNHTYLDLKELTSTQSIVKDYLSQQLNSFVSNPPSDEGISKAISERTFGPEKRKTLVNVFKRQYQNFNQSDLVQKNFNALLQENTFTVTTGHQLNLFTGPLYTIYKTLHTIALAQRLNEQHPHQYFVPVFWLASEDHDLLEINHIHLFQKKYTWETSQTGAVGQMNGEGIKELLEEIKLLFGNSEKTLHLIEVFEKAYQLGDLATATQYIFNELMGEFGLLVLNPDDAELKTHFLPYMIKDIVDEYNDTYLQSQTAELGKLYKTQVFPRQVNFFHLTKGQRERIKSTSEGGTKFTAEYITEHIAEFSPNVCLRPLYQEVVLPNIIYLGGPGEIGYWLQFKKMFDGNGVQFPVLIPRYSAYIQSQSFLKKWNKLGFESMDIFKKLDDLIALYISRNASLVNLQEQKDQLELLRNPLIEKVKSVDPTLAAQADAFINKTLEQLQGLDKKIEKVQKQKFETELAKITQLCQEQFPEGSPPDRYFNYMQFMPLMTFEELISNMKQQITGCLLITE
ncbi:MAG: bacillithiol biosynthesis cysteine-adding enzyme BshC [Bacteroidetes bacterium]|nr:bacillithiol biosynthesis cysteine-adding enzyme BshC [Bacteroidota bacterium]